MKNIRKNFQKAFTLVELLVVIGILAILTAVVLVAVNPARQLQQARDTERRAEINAILSAITAYIADPDNLGAVPSTGGTIDTCPTMSTVGTDTGNVNLSTDLVTLYIADIPIDPSGATAGDTAYEVCQSAADGRITVSAPNAEGVTGMSVTR
ncbi:MAG TPA: type II secretion system protein [Patescibacteria group bacterium]|nr:type II secretion system protein [Patescibacteria group bacterium]